MKTAGYIGLTMVVALLTMYGLLYAVGGRMQLLDLLVMLGVGFAFTFIVVSVIGLFLLGVKLLYDSLKESFMRLL